MWVLCAMNTISKERTATKSAQIARCRMKVIFIFIDLHDTCNVLTSSIFDKTAKANLWVKCGVELIRFLCPG